MKGIRLLLAALALVVASACSTTNPLGPSAVETSETAERGQFGSGS